jgi:hypothetical protein
MQTIIFKLLGVVLVGSIAGAYYVWQEAIKVPSEYIEASTNDRSDSQPLPLQPSQITQRSMAIGLSSRQTPKSRSVI